ncbi:hypothetical protein [Hyphomicrobium sp. CS1BSMeth3]|uniref:hypothetical protein n=1 Tax=Hyphomicrobium sp. CS1BSMeth3 TaxID=1892844 RepID=UPI00092FF7EB|nr:hypothetical protein [Hyphomicrobium sp. CS1BSMeth3]
MRICVSALSFMVLAALAMHGGPAMAAPLSARALASAEPGIVQTVGHRTYHRAHRHHGKRGYRHRKCRKGWLPPLKEHRHLPGKWSHRHCKGKDWYRCHYYFYGYKQWSMWNPGKSRAYFRRHYHH